MERVESRLPIVTKPQPTGEPFPHTDDLLMRTLLLQTETDEQSWIREALRTRGHAVDACADAETAPSASAETPHAIAKRIILVIWSSLIS